MSNKRNARRNTGTGTGRTNNRRLSTEAKDGYKTTDFIAYLAAVVGVLLAS